MRSLIILGTGGNAYDILDVVQAINARGPIWRVEGFLDDRVDVDESRLGYPVLGRIDDARRFPHSSFVNAVGSDNSFRIRSDVMHRTGVPMGAFVTLIHPAASVSRGAILGCGVVINVGASVAGAVVIGNDVQIGPGCIIGHDTVIDDHTILAPGAIVSGFVSIGRNCYIGAGAKIRQRQITGEQSLVGLGAVVIRDVPARTTVVGNPARPISRRKAELRSQTHSMDASSA